MCIKGGIYEDRLNISLCWFKGIYMCLLFFVIMDSECRELWEKMW